MTLPAEALTQIFELLPETTPEILPLNQALGQVLIHPAHATRDQPPFSAAMMDGYALNGVEADPEAMFHIIGEAAAGHGFDGQVGPGECVRIFTGAPLPKGANRVIKQEQATHAGNLLTLARKLDPHAFIRLPGADFAVGDTLSAPRVLAPQDLARLGAMNVAKVTVARRPIVAIVPTGDELVMPGEHPRPDQILASNTFALAAIIEKYGATARVLPIARDTQASLQAALALADDADLILTTGGASVGDYDILAGLGESHGVSHAFCGLAMRPGKHMLAGTIGSTAFFGLPGNPNAVFVLAQVFLVPALNAMLGLGAYPAPENRAVLTAPLAENPGCQTYQSAHASNGEIVHLSGQQAAFLSPQSKVNALLVRPAGDPAHKTGAQVGYLPL